MSLFILFSNQPTACINTVEGQLALSGVNRQPKHSGYAVKMSRIAGVLRRTFGLTREHVGTDHLGNKYYIIPEQKTWTGKPYCAKISSS